MREGIKGPALLGDIGATNARFGLLDAKGVIGDIKVTTCAQHPGLAEAAENRSTFSIDKVLLFCYHYDPVENKYVLFATNFMKAGGVLTVLVLGLFLFRMVRSEHRRKEHFA